MGGLLSELPEDVPPFSGFSLWVKSGFDSFHGQEVLGIILLLCFS
jgi:hypothetical protein